MKNYLSDSLSDEEKLEVIGIIWMTAKNHKFKAYQKSKIEIELIDNLDLACDDLYFFENNSLIDYYFNVLTETEKMEIVEQLNILLDELSLFQLKRALTFNEKLVFFFIFIERYKYKKVSFLLSVDRKTIYNYRKSITNKIERMKESYNGKQI